MCQNASTQVFQFAGFNFLAVQESSLSPSRSVEFVQRWVVEKSHIQLFINHKSNRNANEMKFLDKVDGSIDWIDYPCRVGRQLVGACGFLGDESGGEKVVNTDNS